MPPKRQTSQQKLSLDELESLERSKQEAEERRKKIDEERISRLATEKKLVVDSKARAEEEARKSAELAAVLALALKKAQEEERQRKEKEGEELRRRRQEEEELKRAAEERKKKMEADRRRQLEEQALRAEEERKKLEEERRIQEEEDLKLVEELKNNEPIMQVKTTEHHQPTYDLLGGSLDVEPDVDIHAPEEDYYQEDVYSNYSEASSSNWRVHREQPQRGAVDGAVDSILDHIPVTIVIKKTSKTDGTYLFGTRIMKTKFGHDFKLQVVVGSKMMTIHEFVNKYEKVEAIKVKGLLGAMPLIQFMTAKKT